ncbi:LacI family transcriptional regulator [Ligilactobacillus salitolerans]|uniref:LacI family transcriptional regulator n=1 Tax=Ligilactobacillus salitolerans TaxID=1808352 RepID=A0A401IRA7_9LACO|nr:LacI family DNA-binding transcriptional regulator [Ligilactobacillus salitolerans]GBG94070.1 LacI family transcriptional regulator [Ligilactobacillus salitolerans]
MATMDDVSKEAHVSRGTVSNYINGKPVKADNVEKIKKAIEKLDYVPNASAQSLKRNRSDYVVFIIPRVNTPFFSQLTNDIQLALREMNLKMILCVSESEAQKEMIYIQMAKSQKVAGIITISYSDIEDLVPADIPLVALEKQVSNFFPLIISDNFRGGQIAAQKLVEGNSSKLLYIAQKPEYEAGANRRKGFVDYCERNQISYQTFFSKNKKMPQQDFQEFIEENLENQHFKYDGVFCETDEFAFSFWGALKEQGIKVPQDVQVIGFDGIRVFPRQEPILASIKQPTNLIAKFAVEYLMNLIDSGHERNEEFEPLVLPVSYIPGKSVR